MEIKIFCGHLSFLTPAWMFQLKCRWVWDSMWPFPPSLGGQLVAMCYFVYSTALRVNVGKSLCKGISISWYWLGSPDTPSVMKAMAVQRWAVAGSKGAHKVQAKGPGSHSAFGDPGDPSEKPLSFCRAEANQSFCKGGVVDWICSAHGKYHS